MFRFVLQHPAVANYECIEASIDTRGAQRVRSSKINFAAACMIPRREVQARIRYPHIEVLLDDQEVARKVSVEGTLENVCYIPKKSRRLTLRNSIPNRRHASKRVDSCSRSISLPIRRHCTKKPMSTRSMTCAPLNSLLNTIDHSCRIPCSFQEYGGLLKFLHNTP